MLYEAVIELEKTLYLLFLLFILMDKVVNSIGNKYIQTISYVGKSGMFHGGMRICRGNSP